MGSQKHNETRVKIPVFKARILKFINVPSLVSQFLWALILYWQSFSHIALHPFTKTCTFWGHMICLKLYFLYKIVDVGNTWNIKYVINYVHFVSMAYFAKTHIKIFNISYGYSFPFVLTLLHLIQFLDYLKYQWYVYIIIHLER